MASEVETASGSAEPVDRILQQLGYNSIPNHVTDLQVSVTHPFTTKLKVKQSICGPDLPLGNSLAI